MGVSGAGKTTIGRALADELHWRFAEGDDFHSAANIAKMHAGIPLTDEDRAPWLQSLRNAIAGWLAAGENVVLACSALKASYRADSAGQRGSQVRVLARQLRIDCRSAWPCAADTYMNPDLLRSQFDTLEEPKDTLTIDAESAGRDRLSKEIRAGLGV